MRRVDEQARKILERAENLQPEEFLKMHGTLREMRETTRNFSTLRSSVRQLS